MALAARATFTAALERRETCGCRNRRSPDVQVNFVWSPSTGVTQESIPPIPEEILALMGVESVAGKLLE